MNPTGRYKFRSHGKSQTQKSRRDAGATKGNGAQLKLARDKVKAGG